MFKAWLKRWLGFEALQKAHDLRAVLNSRLSAENARLRKELSHQPKKKKPAAGAQRHIDQMNAAHANRMALLHAKGQRYNIIIDMLRDYVTDAQFLAICEEVNAMTDEQVMGYQKPRKLRVVK